MLGDNDVLSIRHLRKAINVSGKLKRHFTIEKPFQILDVCFASYLWTDHYYSVFA